MKQIAVITPVPDVINTLIENSMLRKSIENEVVKFHVVNLRDYGKGRYRQVDDAPFGGGGGMVMMAEPLSKAIDDTIDIILELKRLSKVKEVTSILTSGGKDSALNGQDTIKQIITEYSSRFNFISAGGITDINLTLINI